MVPSTPILGPNCASWCLATADTRSAGIPNRLAESAGWSTGGASEILDEPAALRNGSVQTARHRALSVASHVKKIIGKLCAGKRHAQFERGLYIIWKRASNKAETAP